MWTAENGPRYNRDKLRHPSDLTDEEWLHIEPVSPLCGLTPPGKSGGGKRTVDLREVVNGLMYILSTGCQWRALPKDLPVMRGMLRGALFFVVPLCVLIYCLFIKFLAPDTSVIYATASLLIVMAAVKPASLRPIEILKVLESTGRSLVQPVVIAALAGIILGMGMPAVAIYILLAVLLAPALEEFGVPPLAAHLFIYYFGIMSYVTPPMAFACFVSGPMAGADPFRTGIEGMKLSVVAYVVPFLFVVYPELLLVGHWADVLVAMATAITGAGCLAAAVAGFTIRRLSWLERLAFVVAALALMTSEIYSDVIGIALIVGLWVWLRRTKHKPKFSAVN